MPTNAQPPKPVDIELSSLQSCEEYVIAYLETLQPGVSHQKVIDFRQRTLGMSEKQRARQLQDGVEALQARGVIRPQLDDAGKPMFDEQGRPKMDVLPVRVIDRMKSIPSAPALIH